MIAAAGGGIVNISSTWGTTTSPQVAAYCASKWGLEGLTQALAQELPPPLFTVAVNPGVIHTQMLETCFGDAAQSYPSPEAWAAAAMTFLLSLSRRDNGGSLRVPL
jgi:NAD(P)-dependent dehydrogenase (short-subunit alcohol dehydrogenase family)